MKRAFLVAAREFMENIRTKGFWIGIMMLPLMLVMIATVPLLVEGTREAKRFTVIDRSGWLLPRVMNEVSTNAARFEYVDPASIDPGDLNALVSAGDLFAYFIIGPDPVKSSDGSRYVSNNLTDRDLVTWLGGLVNQEVRRERLRQENLDVAIAEWLSEPITFVGVQISKEGTEEQVRTKDVVRQWTPVVFVYLLWISILINTQMLLTNTIEEKSNKLIEVLLSSISPIALMAGKIMGIAGTGLAVIGAWALMAFGFFVVLPGLLDISLPFDVSSVISDPWFLTSFLVYFILGYLLYAALLVGLGSICNNLKEAQNLMLPIQLVQMIPIFVMIPIGKDPGGTLAQVLSYVPPLTPFVMMNRAAAPPTTMEYVTTTILLLVSIAAALWFAAKIFRIGILLTGKPPGLMEVLRWLRAPVSNNV
ncbi:MAG: ABC transporter permease [Pseudomonadales bacterium]